MIGRYLAGVPWRRADRAWASLVLMLEAAALVLLLVLPPRIPNEWLPGPLPRVLLVAVAATGAIALLAVALRPTAGRATAALAGLVAAAWLVVVVFFLPAFVSAQPNRAIARDVARERRYWPDLRMAFCSDPTRVRRDVLLHVRLAAVAECDLWSLAGSAPAVPAPRDPGAGRVLPRRPPLPRDRPLPLRAGQRAHAGGLFSVREPGEVVLGANFTTADPEAERKKKRAYRWSLGRGPAESAAPVPNEAP